MAYFALLWKGRTIEKYRTNYEKKKIESLLNDEVDTSRRLFMEKHKNFHIGARKQMEQKFRLWCPAFLGNVLFYLRTDQTFPNFLLKSILGFVGGIILTYLCFMFFVFQLSISLIHATIMSSVIGVLLTLGLAFSYRVRCLVFLLIPQFFSRVGRYTLTCYALILILTGPATNTLKNSEVLSESMACGQEQIKSNVKQINEFLKNPLILVKDSIKNIVERMKYTSSLFKKMLLRTNRLALSIVRIFQSSFLWLHTTAPLCNEEFDTPYNRCMFLMNQEISRNNISLSKDYEVGYQLTRIVESICANVKPYNSICKPQEYSSENIGTLVKRRLKNFSEHIKAMLYVDTQIHHSYSYSANVNKTGSQTPAGIITEIRNRADPLITWLSWSSCGTSLFLVLIIFRAKYYQHMFETRSRFDNQYVTKELLDLDLKRQKQGRETILPLNRREQMKYITATSFKLVPSEKIFLSRSAVFMIITTFKLLIHIVADYSLFWILTIIRHHGRFQTTMPPGYTNAGIKASGKGPVAKFLQNIIDSLNIPLTTPYPSPIVCLPDPLPPDLRRYTQIGVLIFLLWFFALFEPYGLRLRHVIMGMYRPERAKARAAWLYNHILSTRGSFMKYARRKLHRQFKYSTETKLTFRYWLNSYIPCWWLQSLLGTAPEEPHCLLCSTREIAKDPDTALVQCETPDCPGIFCISCFSDIGELCTICLTPADYGDLSDISLEKGSSDDENYDDEEYDEDDEYEEPGSNSNMLDRKKCYRTLKMYRSHRYKDRSKNPKPSKRTSERIPLLKKYTTENRQTDSYINEKTKCNVETVPTVDLNNKIEPVFINAKLNLNIVMTQSLNLKQYYNLEDNFLDVTFSLDIKRFTNMIPNLHLIFVSDKLSQCMFDDSICNKFSVAEKACANNKPQRSQRNAQKTNCLKKFPGRTRNIKLSKCCFFKVFFKIFRCLNTSIHSNNYNVTRKKTSLCVSKDVVPRKVRRLKRRESKRVLSKRTEQAINLYFRNVNYMNFQSVSKLGLENVDTLPYEDDAQNKITIDVDDNSNSHVDTCRSVADELVASVYKGNDDPLQDQYKYKSSEKFAKTSKTCGKKMLNTCPKHLEGDALKSKAGRKYTKNRTSDKKGINDSGDKAGMEVQKKRKIHHENKLNNQNQDIAINTSIVDNTVDKIVSVKPKVKSFGCQCKFRPRKKPIKNEVKPPVKTCTCATQHYIETRDVGISTNSDTNRNNMRVRKTENEARKMQKQCCSRSDSDISTVNSSAYSRVVNFILQYKNNSRRHTESRSRRTGDDKDDWWSPRVDKKKENDFKSTSFYLESDEESEEMEKNGRHFALRRRYRKTTGESVSRE